MDQYTQQGLQEPPASLRTTVVRTSPQVVKTIEVRVTSGAPGEEAAEDRPARSALPRGTASPARRLSPTRRVAWQEFLEKISAAPKVRLGRARMHSSRIAGANTIWIRESIAPPASSDGRISGLSCRHSGPVNVDGPQHRSFIMWMAFVTWTPLQQDSPCLVEIKASGSSCTRSAPELF